VFNLESFARNVSIEIYLLTCEIEVPSVRYLVSRAMREYCHLLGSQEGQ